MKPFGLLIILLFCFSAAFAQTPYDQGQDRYVDGLVQALKEQVAELKEDNKDLIKENSQQETEIKILMSFAGVLLLGILLMAWRIIKGKTIFKKLSLIFLLITAFALAGCYAPKPNVGQSMVLCQGCPAIRCLNHYDCHRWGCRFCELRRGAWNPFTCR